MRRRSITDASIKINISLEESQPLAIPEIPTLEDYKGATTAPSNKLVEQEIISDRTSTATGSDVLLTETGQTRRGICDFYKNKLFYKLILPAGVILVLLILITYVVYSKSSDGSVYELGSTVGNIDMSQTSEVIQYISSYNEQLRWYPW